MKLLRLLAVAVLPLAAAQIRGSGNVQEAMDAQQEEDFEVNEIDNFFYMRDLEVGCMDVKGSKGKGSKGTKGSKGSKGSKSSGSKGSKGSKSSGSKGSKGSKSSGSKGSKGSKSSGPKGSKGNGNGSGKGSKGSSGTRAAMMTQKPKIEELKDKQRLEKDAER